MSKGLVFRVFSFTLFKSKLEKSVSRVFDLKTLKCWIFFLCACVEVRIVCFCKGRISKSHHHRLLSWGRKIVCKQLHLFQGHPSVILHQFIRASESMDGKSSQASFTLTQRLSDVQRANKGLDVTRGVLIVHFFQMSTIFPQDFCVLR